MKLLKTFFSVLFSAILLLSATNSFAIDKLHFVIGGGAVAGLVGITPAAGFVSPASGMLIGAITSSLCLLSVNLKIKLSFDDSLDTFAVHGVGGTVGAILTGLFAKSDLIASHPAGIVLREQGRFALILGQFQAVLIAYAIAAIGTFIIAMFLI